MIAYLPFRNPRYVERHHPSGATCPPSSSRCSARPPSPRRGAPSRPRRRQAMALLAFLPARAAPAQPGALAGLLWGESPEVEARASLRQALKHLRDALGDAPARRPGPVRAHRAARVRRARVPARRRASDPARAAAFDVPRFLQGFSVRHAPQFEEWLVATRDGAPPAVPRRARAPGRARGDGAVALARRRRLRRALARRRPALRRGRPAGGRRRATWAGNRVGGAPALRRVSRPRLRKETGCEPSRALEALVRRVEADQSAARHDAGRSPTSGTLNAPPFEASLIGRENAVAHADRGLEAGEPRSGTDRAGRRRVRGREVAARRRVPALGRRGRRNRAARPELRPAGGSPLRAGGRGAARRARRAGAGGHVAPEWLAEVARLVPELRERFPGTARRCRPPRPTEGWRLFEGVAQLIAARRGRAAGRDRDRRSAVVRRGQLPAPPLSRPAAGAGPGALARHAHAGRGRARRARRRGSAARSAPRRTPTCVTLGAADRGGGLAAAPGDGAS